MSIKPISHPYSDTSVKLCTKCGRTKDTSEFYVFTEPVCKKCRETIEKESDRNNAEFVDICRRCAGKKIFSKCDYCNECERFRKRLLKYGIGFDDYDEAVYAQKGLCAICRREPGKKGFQIDHCHKTGRFRGLLCSRCNLALGQFEEKPTIILQAFLYVKRFEDLTKQENVVQSLLE